MEVNGTAACERKSIEMRVCKLYIISSIRVIRVAKDGKATKSIKSGVCVGNFEDAQFMRC